MCLSPLPVRRWELKLPEVPMNRYGEPSTADPLEGMKSGSSSRMFYILLAVLCPINKILFFGPFFASNKGVCKWR
jgi:hypothetical protein